ncbi:hypothetical protein J4Q44_G00326620 [Coregonus suidteri]|uniref:Uncharacterized protein n=1 Tax=Coregonus suidteri TaxID=861788 RepID=A0AAN8KWC5_9TELE
MQTDASEEGHHRKPVRRPRLSYMLGRVVRNPNFEPRQSVSRNRNRNRRPQLDQQGALSHSEEMREKTNPLSGIHDLFRVTELWMVGLYWLVFPNNGFKSYKFRGKELRGKTAKMSSSEEVS